MTKPNKIEAVSYSRYTDHKKCPALAKFKHVDKRKEPEGKASAHGQEVHALAQKVAEGKIKTMPKDFKAFADRFKVLQRNNVLCEQEWAFDKNWKKVDWFAKDVFLRVKMDAHYLQAEIRAVGRTKVNEDVVVVIDFKSGRIYDDHEEQRSLYALGAMLVYPTATRIITKHWYIDQGGEHITEFPATDLEKLKKDWLKKFKPMLNDTRFAPRPGNYCRFCFFRKTNGGPCQF